jgi:hypothetical protein
MFHVTILRRLLRIGGLASDRWQEIGGGQLILPRVQTWETHSMKRVFTELFLFSRGFVTLHR